MREIEIKARVTNKDQTLKNISKLGVVLGSPVKQHDVVYCLPGSVDNALDANWLRLRTENDQKVIFTLKRSVVGHLDSIEHETEIENAEAMISIISLLGFEIYSDLTKIRRHGKLEDVEICIDEIPRLGTFIEAERILDNEADHNQVVSQLWKLLDNIGINKIDEIHLGYDVLERQLRGVK